MNAELFSAHRFCRMFLYFGSWYWLTVYIVRMHIWCTYMYIYIYRERERDLYLFIPLLSVALKGSYSITKGGATAAAPSGSPGPDPPGSPRFQNFPKFPEIPNFPKSPNVPQIKTFLSNSIFIFYLNFDFKVSLKVRLWKFLFMLISCSLAPYSFAKIRYVKKYVDWLPLKFDSYELLRTLKMISESVRIFL